MSWSLFVLASSNALQSFCRHMSHGVAFPTINRAAGRRRPTEQLCRAASPAPACTSTSTRADSSISGQEGALYTPQSFALSHSYQVKYTVQPPLSDMFFFRLHTILIRYLAFFLNTIRYRYDISASKKTFFLRNFRRIFGIFEIFGERSEFSENCRIVRKICSEKRQNKSLV